MKKILPFFLVLLMVMVTACKEPSPAPVDVSEDRNVSTEEMAAEIVKPQWVIDNAKLLNNKQKESLARKLVSFQKSDSTKPQIVVITIESLKGNTIEEYAVDAFRKIKIGNAAHDNGILIVISKGDRKLRIEVGHGFEGSVPDTVANDIIKNQMIPNLKKGSEDWYKAIDSAVDRLIVTAKL